jgi:regulator of replication initiation timing
MSKQTVLTSAVAGGPVINNTVAYLEEISDLLQEEEVLNELLDAFVEEIRELELENAKLNRSLAAFKANATRRKNRNERVVEA